jgi:hypothetical protein
MNPPARPGIDAAQPAVAGAPSPDSVRAIVALSEDPLLLEALTQAAIPQVGVIASPSADRFVDQLMATAAQVALIDAAAAPAPLADFIASLHAQFPQLLLLLAGAPPLQHHFAAQMADGTIFRFVHKPASAQRLKLFIEAALRQPQVLGKRSSAGLEQPTAARTHRWLRIGAVVLAALTVALAALTLAGAGALLWRVLPLHASARASAARVPPAATVAVTSPAATPAPVAPMSASTADTAAEAVDPPPAGTADSETDDLPADSLARAAPLLQAAPDAAPAPDAGAGRIEQAHAYVELARKRLASGALLEPADDSARAFVRSAQAQASKDAEVRAVAVALGEALIGAVRRAIAAGDQQQAARWLKACRDYRVNAATVNQLAAQLEALRSAAATAAVPANPAASALEP